MLRASAPLNMDDGARFLGREDSEGLGCSVGDIPTCGGQVNGVEGCKGISQFR